MKSNFDINFKIASFSKGFAVRFSILRPLTIFVCCGCVMPAISAAQAGKPTVAVSTSLERIVVAPPGSPAPSGCAPTPTMVDFRVSPTGFNGKNIVSDVVVTAGYVVIGKNKFLWDLTGTRPGTYMAIVDAKSEKGELARTTAQIEVVACK